MKVLDRENLGGKLHIGDGCKIDESVEFDTSADIFLDECVAISDDALILTHDHSPECIAQTLCAAKHIGAHVWIGTRAIILASCTNIGRGSVVGAGAVVTRDVPENVLVCGVPAKVVKELAPK